MTLDQAVEHFGSRAALARAVGVSPQAVQQWGETGRIPRGRQFQIEVITRGELKADRKADEAA